MVTTAKNAEYNRAYMREYSKRPAVRARIRSRLDSTVAHDRQVQRKYGLAPGEYARMLEQQGGRCAICGNKPGKYRLAVDHSHYEPFEVRGLLCLRCNRMLGFYEHEPIKAYNLMRYLESIVEAHELRPNAARVTMDRSSKRTKG